MRILNTTKMLADRKGNAEHQWILVRNLHPVGRRVNYWDLKLCFRTDGLSIVISEPLGGDLEIGNSNDEHSLMILTRNSILVKTISRLV